MCERKWKKLELHVGYTKREKKGLVVTWSICGCYRHYNISLFRDTFVWSLFILSVRSIFNSPAGVSAVAPLFLIIQYNTKEKYLYSGGSDCIAEPGHILYGKADAYSPPQPFTLVFKTRCSWLLWLAQGPAGDRDRTRRCKNEFMKVSASSPLFQFTHQSLDGPGFTRNRRLWAATPRQQARNGVLGQHKSHLGPTWTADTLHGVQDTGNQLSPAAITSFAMTPEKTRQLKWDKECR